MRRSQPTGDVVYRGPDLPEWGKTLLVGLFIAYALELAARNMLRLPVDRLVWWPAQDFAFWQPVTRYFVQGNEVVWVFLSGLVLALLLPVAESLPRRQAWQLLGSAILGGTGLALLVQLVGIAAAPAQGWSSLVTALLVAFGLRQPDAIIRLFFVLPVPAWAFVWGTGALAFLSLLAAPGLGTAEHLGTFLGVVAWWNGWGPGARRRELIKKSRSVERQLRKLTVIDGGKGKPDSDVYH